MHSLWLLTKKNLKLLIRAKSSALIVVFAPLLLILILGLSFNNSEQYNLNLGVYSNSFTEDVDSVIKILQEEQFKVIKYDTSLEDCIEDIKLGFTHACIDLPESFLIESNTPKEITFYIDPSKINLVWMVQDTLQKKLNLKSKEISENLAQGILEKLTDTNLKITSEKSKITTIKEQSISASSTIGTSKTELAGLDLQGVTTNYDYNLSTDFKTNLSKTINSSIVKIASAKEIVESSSLNSSAKSDITNKLNSIDKSLDSADKLVSGTGEGSLEKIINLINSLTLDLNYTTTKLNNAAEKVTTTSSNLGTIKSSLDANTKSLEEIQSVLEEIKTNLDTQKVTEAEVISNPLSTKIEQVIPEGTHLNYVFSGLIILVIMFSSILLGTTLVMMEKHSPAYIRNFFLPLKKLTFILSTYFTNLILIFIQIIIILGISLIFFNELYLSLPLMILVLFLSASIFTFIGMCVGYIFTSEDTAVLASVSLGSLMLFFSGMILPLESVSPLLRNIMYYNPFVIAEKLVREIFLYNSPFMAIWGDLLLLLIYMIILFVIILLVQTVLHKRLTMKFLYHHHKKHRQKELNKNI